MKKCHWILVVVMICFLSTLAGCEATKNSIKKADDWVKESMW